MTTALSLSQFILSELSQEGFIGVPLYHFLYILMRSESIKNFNSKSIQEVQDKAVKSNELSTEPTESISENNSNDHLMQDEDHDTLNVGNINNENASSGHTNNNDAVQKDTKESKKKKKGAKKNITYGEEAVDMKFLLESSDFVKYLILLLWKLECIEWYSWKPEMKILNSEKSQVWVATPNGMGIKRNLLEPSGTDKKKKDSGNSYCTSLIESGLIIVNPLHASQNQNNESHSNNGELQQTIQQDENLVLSKETIDDIYECYTKYIEQFGLQLHTNIFENMVLLHINSYFSDNVFWIRLKENFHDRIKEAMNVYTTDACINDNQKVILEMAMRSRESGFAQLLLSQILHTDSKSLSYSVGRLEEIGFIYCKQTYSHLFKREIKSIILQRYFSNEGNPVVNANSDGEFSEMTLQTLKGWNQFQYLYKNCIVLVSQYLQGLKNKRCTAKHLKSKFGFQTSEENQRLVARRRWDKILLRLRASQKFLVYRAKIEVAQKVEIRQIIELKDDENTYMEPQTLGIISEEEQETETALDLPISTQIFKEILDAGPNGINSTDIAEMFNLESKKALQFLSELSRRYPIASVQSSQGSYSNYKFTTTSTSTALFQLAELVGTNSLYFISSKTRVRTPISESNAERILWTLNLLEERKVINTPDIYWLLIEKAKIKFPDRRTVKRIMHFCDYHKLGKLFVKYRGMDEGKQEFLIRNDLEVDSEEVNSIMNSLTQGAKFSNDTDMPKISEDEFSEGITTRERTINSMESRRVKLFFAIRYGFIISPYLRLKEFYFSLLDKCEELLLLNRNKYSSIFEVKLDLVKDVFRSMPLRTAAKILGIIHTDEDYVRRLFAEEVTIGQFQMMQNQPIIFHGHGIFSRFLSAVTPLCDDLRVLKMISIEKNPDKSLKSIKLNNYSIINLPFIWKRPRRFTFDENREKIESFWRILPLYIQNEVDACKDIGADESDTFSAKFPTFSKGNREEVIRIRKPLMKVLYNAYALNPNPTYREMVALHEKNNQLPIEIIFLYFMRHKAGFDRMNPLQLSIKNLTSKTPVKKVKNIATTEIGQRIAWTEENDMELLVSLGLWILTRNPNNQVRVSWTEIAQIANMSSNVRCSRRYKNYLSSLPWVKAGVHSLQRWKRPSINATEDEITELKQSIRTMFEHFKQGHAASMPPHIASNFTHPITIEEFHQLYELSSIEGKLKGFSSDFGSVESSVAHYIKGVLRTPSNEYESIPSRDRILSLGLEEIVDNVNSKLISGDIIVKRQRDEDKRGYHFSQSVLATEIYGRKKLFETARTFRNLLLHPNELFSSKSCLSLSAENYGNLGNLKMKLKNPSPGENMALLNLMMNDTIRLIPEIPKNKYESTTSAFLDDTSSQNEMNLSEEGLSGIHLLRGHGIILPQEEAKETIFHNFRGYNLRKIDLHLEYISEPNPFSRQGKRFLSEIPQFKLQNLLRRNNEDTMTNNSNLQQKRPREVDTFEYTSKRQAPTEDRESDVMMYQSSNNQQFSILDGISIYIKDTELKPFINFIMKRFKYANAEDEIYQIMELYDIVNEGKSEGKTSDELMERCPNAFTQYIEDFENFYLIRRINGLNSVNYVGMKYANVHTVAPWIVSEEEQESQVPQDYMQDIVDIAPQADIASHEDTSSTSNTQTQHIGKQLDTPQNAKDQLQIQDSTRSKERSLPTIQKLFKFDKETPPFNAEPWVKVNGSLNYELIGNIKRSIIEKINDNPGISEVSLMKFLCKLLGDTLAMQILEEMIEEQLIYYNDYVVENKVALFSTEKSRQRFYFSSQDAYFISF